jgi:hypothetical protein
MQHSFFQEAKCSKASQEVPCTLWNLKVYDHVCKPVTCPYPEPDEPSSCSPALILKDPFQYDHPIYTQVFQVVFFLDASASQCHIRFSSSPQATHAFRI